MDRSIRQLYSPFSICLFAMMLSCNGPAERAHADILTIDWKQAGLLPGNGEAGASPGLAGPVAGITDHVLLIGGGSNFPFNPPWSGGAKVYYKGIYVYKKVGDSLVNIKSDARLPYNVAYSANCSTSKGIVMAGGENESGATAKVLLINWNNTKQGLDIQYLPDLPQPLTNGAITVNNDRVYFAGGENDHTVSGQFYALNLNDISTGWQTLTALPKPVTNTVLYVQSNGADTCIYLVGGRKRNIDAASDLYNEVYQYNLNTRHWIQKASLPYALSAHTGVAVNDSALLVFSGDQGKIFHATELLMMKIAREKDPDKKKQLIEEKNELQKSHPGFSGNVLWYNTHTDKWIKADSIPFPGQVTTTALKWDNDIVIPCGEIRAGVRTPVIIMGKIQGK